MNKTKLLTAAVAGLLIINLVTLTFLFFSKPGNPIRLKPGGFPEGPKRIIIDKLRFDEQQVMKYEMLIRGHRKQVVMLEKEVYKTKNELYLTLSSSNDSQKDSLEKRLGAIQTEIETVHYNHFVAIKKLCYKNQLKDFDDLTHDLANLFNHGKNIDPPAKDPQ